MIKNEPVNAQVTVMKEEQLVSFDTINYNEQEIIGCVMLAIHVLKLKSTYKNREKQGNPMETSKVRETGVEVHLHDTM